MKNTLGLFFYEKYTLYLLTQEWTTTSKVKCYGINMDFCISQCRNSRLFHSDLKGIKFRQKPQLGKIDFKILMVEKS